jgi:3-oxoacyl-[acyl-carrier protein] reductase
MTASSGAVVITGAARGIGLAIARHMSREGLTPVLVDRDEAVRDVASELGAERACPVVCDLTEVKAAISAIRSAVGELDVPLTGLVNNAGITQDALLEKMTEEQFQSVLAVNLESAYRLTLSMIDVMPGPGAVVSLSSRSWLGSVGQVNYALSKGALVGMTRALAISQAPRVRVNAVAPALIDTPMVAAMPDRIRDKLIGAIPFGRLGEATEVADAVAWLMSDHASYVTGQCLLVCGGRSLQ